MPHMPYGLQPTVSSIFVSSNVPFAYSNLHPLGGAMSSPGSLLLTRSRDILRRHLSIHGKAAGGTPIPIPGGGARSAGRTPNACENCARSKTKCEPSDSNADLCKRCFAKNLTCVLRPGRRNARRKTDASEESILKSTESKEDSLPDQQDLLSVNRELQEENRRKELELEQARQQLQQLQTQQQQIQDMSQSQSSWDVTAFLDQQSPTFSDPNMTTYQANFPSPGIPTPPSDTPMYEHFFSGASGGIPPTPGSGSLNFSPPNGMIGNQDAANVNGYMNQLNFSALGNDVDMLNHNVFAHDFSEDLVAASTQTHMWSDPSPHQRMGSLDQSIEDYLPYFSHMGHDPLATHHRGSV